MGEKTLRVKAHRGRYGGVDSFWLFGVSDPAIGFQPNVTAESTLGLVPGGVYDLTVREVGPKWRHILCPDPPCQGPMYTCGQCGRSFFVDLAERDCVRCEAHLVAESVDISRFADRLRVEE